MSFIDPIIAAAEQGDADAQCRLARQYRTGLGVPKDFKKEAAWYRKAAEQGHAGAQFCLGDMYLHGRGVQQSDQKAASWYRKSAEQGDAAG
ncbi:tetratricopeptide repeat protein, partial [Aeromonas veronii]|uniref:tetratricopeptide repeat protein n=1 Tax=Aeromonas veronii TaxID=654 RepID=UPI003D2609DB